MSNRGDVKTASSMLSAKDSSLSALRLHLTQVRETPMAIFDQTYRIIAVDSHCLTIRGNVSGEVLTMVNTASEFPLTQKGFLVGQLIELTDPSASAPN